MDLLSASRQYHQLNTIIKFSTIFESLLSTNHTYIKQASDIQIKFQIIIEYKQTLYYPLCLLTLTHYQDPLRTFLLIPTMVYTYHGSTFPPLCNSCHISAHKIAVMEYITYPLMTHNKNITCTTDV